MQTTQRSWLPLKCKALPVNNRKPCLLWLLLCWLASGICPTMRRGGRGVVVPMFVLANSPQLHDGL
jgi:hypothetical protein